MAGERIWRDLDPAQAHGWACVVCGRDFLRQPYTASARGMPDTAVQRVAVGRSESGSPVFACGGDGDRCADRGAGRGWALLRIPEEALAAAGAAFVAELERATASTPTGDPRHVYPDEVVAAAVEAAAPLVVAAELRRLVELGTERPALWAWGGHWVRELRDRADELDPVGRR
ncbi:MAG: hypothetical protein ACRDS1_02110 [Pseudonocardiaceae bacterium]